MIGYGIIPMFWIIAIAIGVVAALLISLPLFKPARPSVDGFSNDAEVYRDQLSELDRDMDAGLISGDEARQARAEIARRLIAVSEAGASSGARMFRRPALVLLAVFVCVLLPAGAFALYARMGNPDQPDQPLAARYADPRPDINILIAKAEKHLVADPNDGHGWELLAPIYMRQRRAEEAANAYRNAIRLLGDDAGRWGALGESLAAAARGEVTRDARTAFEKALQSDPTDPRARFYVALADVQAGQADKALAEFTALAKDSPADAPWQAVLQAQIEQLTAMKNGAAKAPGNPDASDVAAAAQLNADDRAQMIRTMVTTLDERLRTDPRNIEGWKRLIRSYLVLGEADKASDAVKRGLAAFPATGDDGKSILALAKDLGLPANGVTE